MVNEKTPAASTGGGEIRAQGGASLCLATGAVLDQAAHGLQRLEARGAFAGIYTDLLAKPLWVQQAVEGAENAIVPRT